MNPRSRPLKLRKFGNTDSNSVALNPNHRPSVAPYWSTDVLGSSAPLPTWSGLLSNFAAGVFLRPRRQAPDKEHRDGSCRCVTAQTPHLILQVR